jgi:hypothetical protein
MSRIARILKHRLLDEADTRRVIGVEAAARIEARIAASELLHSGEICICVEAGLPLSYLWRGASARERALMMFSKLRVWDTESNSGVLIYLLLAEHAIEIVADRGVCLHVPPGHWDRIVAGLSEDLHAGRYEPGLLRAIDAVDELLAKHFAIEAGARNPNELSNRPRLM